MSKTTNEDPAVTRFREYLRLPSVHPDPDYSGCIEWLRNQANEIGIVFNLVEFPKPSEFAIWMTWKGRDSSLKSILLNSHIDVVPVDVRRWTHEPFGEEKDADGNIYARGSQDMKCVGVQYLEVIRRLKSKGFVPLRDVHVSFVPDEEVGTKGMSTFVKTPEFQSLNIGLAFDEGIASPTECFNLYYGERSLWQIEVRATGNSGHGSIMLDNTAAEKIHKFIGKMLALRTEQKTLMEESNLDLGAVTSVNLTGIRGGSQVNIVPSEIFAIFDIRVTPKMQISELRKLLDNFCTESGAGVTYSDLSFSDSSTGITNITKDNPWWTTFTDACNNLRIQVNPQIFPAYTDSSLIRPLGISAFGFSPMNHTPVLLHDHDEFLNENIFLRGIEIYETILEKIINLPKEALL